MATIETVDFGTVGKMVQGNISGLVGEGLTNDRNDVLPIQTLFKIIGDGGVFTRALFGLEPQKTNIAHLGKVRDVLMSRETVGI